MRRIESLLTAATPLLCTNLRTWTGASPSRPVLDSGFLSP